MSQMGHSRRFERAPGTSASPQEADIRPRSAPFGCAFSLRLRHNYCARIGRPPDKPISTFGFLVRPLVRRGVLAMIDEDREKKTGPRAPRLIPVIRTEYDRLCEDLGGPADIGVVGISKYNLASYCHTYPTQRVLPVLIQYTPDETLARKHWPWVAFAISEYDYETKELTTYSDEPTPEEVEDLLSQIEKSSRDLNSGLCRLQVLSNRLRDPTAPHRRGHLGWLDAYISQAAAGLLSDDVNESDQHFLVVASAKTAFLERLVDVEVATKLASQRIDRTLLERERGQSNPALLQFVLRCSPVWRSLTGRKPSANKVSRNGREDPDFVVFLQRLARIGCTYEPTRGQVARCLRNLVPATTDQKSL